MSQPFSHNHSTSNNAYQRVRRLSQFMDNAIPIPGTSYRIGIDPLLGFFPGMGDYLTAFVSGYIVLEAGRLGVSRFTLLRMILNVIIDTIVGLIPGIGDLFDVVWKANAKNTELLEKQLAAPETREKADWLFLVMLLVIMASLLIGLTLLSGWIIVSLIQASPFL